MAQGQKRILIIEDEYTLLRTLAFTLKRNNYTVISAIDGVSGLSEIEDAQKNHSPFDLIITDIELPGLNGLKLISEVKSRGISSPIIVISGNGSREITMKCKEKGCAAYMDKPFDAAQLMKCISMVLTNIDF